MPLKPAPKRLDMLIKLVNCLPLEGTVEFQLLQPFIIDSELRFGIDAEETLRVNASFAKPFLETDPTRWLQFSLQRRRESQGIQSPLEERVLLVEGRLKRLNLPHKLVEFLNSEDLYRAWWRWQTLFDARLALYEVALSAALLTNDFNKPRRLNALPLVQSAAPRRTLYVDPYGFLREERDLFSAAIDAGDVEPQRIKICPHCNRLFWAGRLPKSGCSPTCINAINSMNSKARAIERALKEAELERSKARKRAKERKP